METDPRDNRIIQLERENLALKRQTRDSMILLGLLAGFLLICQLVTTYIALRLMWMVDELSQ